MSVSIPIVFFDLETRSKVDLKKHGLHRYARDESTEVIVMSAYFPDGTHGVWAPEDRRAGLTLRSADWVIREWNEWVRSGGLVAAWNAAFDRTVLKYWNGPLEAPALEQTLCAMAQAENYSLPAKLGNAAACLRVPVQKDSRGGYLIRKLSNGNVPWAPDPQDVADFWVYAMKDTLAMVEVWKRTRPWTREEWHDYHVIERINENGIAVDTEFAAAACRYAQAEMDELNAELQDLVGDPGIKLSSSARKVKWLRSLIDGTVLEKSIYMRRGRKAATASTGGPAIHALQEKYDEVTEAGTCDVSPEVWDKIQQFIDILEKGNGVAIKKFVKVGDLEVAGRLFHQFNCSPTITGRHASRGVQFDNVLRDPLPQKPVDDAGIDDDAALYVIDRLVEERKSKQTVEELRSMFGMSISKILARLIRPSIIAPDHWHLVWGDWSAIEARMLPWLAGAESYLDAFRKGECIYCKEAVKIFGLAYDWQELYGRYEDDDPEATRHRLLGKIAVLALGYQGGVGALNNMARGYGVRLDQNLAQSIKVGFREANPWLRRFWKKLDEASWRAVRHPGAEAVVGRLRYVRHGNDLFCFLPDKRPIVYPQVKIERVYKEHFDAELDVITYRKLYSGTPIRGELYPGVLSENATQGTATGSLLRHTLARLDALGYEIWAPKHDEVLLCTSEDPERVVDDVRAIMETAPDWAPGLPLKADVRSGAYYGK